MDARIAALRGHVVICGYGRVGASAAEFLTAGGQQVVVVDADPARLQTLDPGRLVSSATSTTTRCCAAPGSSTPGR